ncbi:hypothetical protein ABZ461_23505 [Actinacidiphila glaucinigra]|uniref:hypothetical protein n=1 Tax=Actinacidiphila glaucinigra TaxID=235986 RepID=UPI0033D02BE7
MPSLWRPAAGRTGLLACAVAAVAFLLGAAPPASAVPHCRIGAYVTDLYDFEVTPRTVQADLWLWSVCPTAGTDAVKRLEFVNATRVTVSDESTEKVGDQYWSQVKVSGTFRQKFSLSQYPFDKQTVRILVEDWELDEAELVYSADARNSGYDHGIELGQFTITGFDVRVGRHDYRTTFGDPRLQSGEGSRYSQFVVQLSISRADVTGFVRETWPVYVAFLISAISYLVMPKELLSVVSSRFGIQGAAIFAIVVNMRASGEPGTAFGVTPVDQIHLVTLAYVLVAVGTTTYLVWAWSIPGKRSGARRLNYAIAAVSTVLYFAANAVTIAFALT